MRERERERHKLRTSDWLITNSSSYSATTLFLLRKCNRKIISFKHDYKKTQSFTLIFRKNQNHFLTHQPERRKSDADVEGGRVLRGLACNFHDKQEEWGGRYIWRNIGVFPYVRKENRKWHDNLLYNLITNS